VAYGFFSIVSNSTNNPPQKYKSDLQAFIDSDFNTATSYYVIQEETAIGTNVYQDTGARINHAVTTGTSINLGDDWREVIFQDFSHARGMGFKYQFNGFTWLTINSDFYKFATASSTVRRCNYVLKWYDDYRNLIEEECIVDYFKFSATNLVKENVNALTGNAYRFIVLQDNDKTRLLRRNKRFIIEDRAWRIYDVDKITKKGLVLLSLSECHSNSVTDDLVNNIADAFLGSGYVVQLITQDIALNSGQSAYIESVVYKDGMVYNANLNYLSSTPTGFSVSSSGLVTGILVCNGTVRVSLQENSNIYGDVSVTIASTPLSNISEQLIGESSVTIGQQATYEIYKLINGIDNGNTYSFSLSNSNFTLVSSSGNSATLKAGKAVGLSCILTATNNVTSAIITKTITTSSLW